MAGYFSQEFIDRVAQANDIVRVVSRYTHLVKKGPRYLGLCPFHNEKTPSFTVTQDKGLFYCFGCGEGGNLFSFVMKMENLSFAEAVEYLADLAGIPIEYEKNTGNEIKKDYARKKLMMQVNKEAGNFYYLQYRRSAQAKAYINSRRISEQTAKTFALGFAPEDFDALYRYLRYKGFDDDLLLDCGLIVRGKDGKLYDYFRNRLMFPILDTSKTVVGFGGRVFDDGQPKYLNSRETTLFHKQNLLYNLFRARSVKDRALLVVEGYMDVIGLYDNGITEAVACLGTSFSASHAALIQRNAQNGVLLCFDGDEAGIKAALRSGEILSAADVYAKLLLLPDGHDPDSYVREYGKEAFYALCDTAKDYYEFCIDRFAGQTDFSNADALMKFDLKCLQMLKEQVDTLKWQYYLKRIANHSGTHVNVLMDRLKTINTRQFVSKRDEEQTLFPKKKKITREQKALQTVFAKMLADITAYQKILQLGFTDKLLFDEADREVYECIKKNYETKEKFELDQDLCYNNALANKLSALAILSGSVTWEECKDCIKTLKVFYLTEELERVKKQILSETDGQKTHKEEDLFAYFASLKTKLANIETGSDVDG